MCIAIPAEVISIEPDDTGVVSYAGNEMTVSMRLVTPQVGDFVLIHAGCAIEIVTKDTADEITEIYKLLEEVVNEE
jgi:hydrogenase expression/formation protein HypC